MASASGLLSQGEPPNCGGIEIVEKNQVMVRLEHVVLESRGHQFGALTDPTYLDFLTLYESLLIKL